MKAPTGIRPPRSSGSRRASVRGAAVVFVLEMRRRDARRDLALTAAIQALLLAAAAGTQRFWADASVYSNVESRFLERWLLTAMVLATVALAPLAAISGAEAVPASEEFEPVQSMLVTDLTPLDIVVGRLTARLWPVTSTAMLSCAFWLTAGLVRGLGSGGSEEIARILSAHLVLLSEIALFGMLGFLFALRRRPGRAMGRGALGGIALFALCLFAIGLINPIVARMNKPERVIQVALLINPVTATGSSAGANVDLLRAPWIYDRLNAPEYQFSYPPPLATAALFLAIAGVAALLSATRLRRAYR